MISAGYVAPSYLSSRLIQTIRPERWRQAYAKGQETQYTAARAVAKVAIQVRGKDMKDTTEDLTEHQDGG